MADRSVTVRSGLLRLPQMMARVVVGMPTEQAIGYLEEEIAQVAKEMRPFDAADFRAKEVQERSSEPDGAEPDESDAEG
jgi:hypothetical protein